MAEARAKALGAGEDAGPFERDTAVSMDGERGSETRFDAFVADGWRAGRGPHGGYLAAIVLRALQESVAEQRVAVLLVSLEVTL